MERKPSASRTRINALPPPEYAPRLFVPITDGIVLVGSDLHIWPGPWSPAMRAWLYFLDQLKPKVQVLNGDVFDFPQISRHTPIGWEDHPTLLDELLAGQSFLEACEDYGRKARRVWSLGNHDARFETRLAHVAPEFRGVQGIHLKDHFPAWEPCWSAEVGGREGAIVKHRWKGGAHAPFNNAQASGRTMVTAHNHSLQVVPYTDYTGTRWGVDCGMLADPHHPRFSYAEDNPQNWRAGFVVLTFHKGSLLWPEVVSVRGKREVEFRGEVFRV